jgi:hypothetical protein
LFLSKQNQCDEMSQQKVLEEFYELGALRLSRVERLPNDALEQCCRHTLMGIARDEPPAFFWARRVFRAKSGEVFAQVTFATPMTNTYTRSAVMVPPGIYRLSARR